MSRITCIQKNDSIFVFFGKVRLMIGEAADCRPGRVCRGMRRVLLNGIATEMSLPPFKAHTLFLHQTGAIKIKRARQKKNDNRLMSMLGLSFLFFNTLFTLFLFPGTFLFASTNLKFTFFVGPEK